ncbi:MAG: hypothetical protein ABR510_00655 [Trueperaceae bacterium]
MDLVDPSVRLLGHVGRLRERPSSGSDDEPRAAVRVWEGAVAGPDLARVLRAALDRGALPCDVAGVPHRADVGSCWYDAATGLLVVELRAPLRPLV